MTDPSKLSRRERQIMDILHNLSEATVREIQSRLPDPPTPMAIRATLKILEDKDYLKRRKEGREVVYRPREARHRAGSNALRHVLETFFEGSVEQALSVHFSDKGTQISDKEYRELIALIKQARNQGR